MPKHGRGYWFDKAQKRWRIRFAVGGHGRSYRESLGPEWTERQVIERVAQLRKQAIERTLGRYDRPIQDALDVFLDRAELFKGYGKLRGHVKKIWPWIEGKMLSEIGDVARSYRKFHRNKLSGATINRRVAILRRCANIAWKELGWIDRPVFFEMAKEKGRTMFLTIEQVDQLLGIIEQLAAPWDTKRQVVDAVNLAVCTGWREGELWRLTQASVRWDMLVLADSKNDEPRISPIHERAKGAVSRLPFTVTAHTVCIYFKRACRELGIPAFRFHDLRHTTASLIINAGGSLKDVQEVLGQKSPASAQIYAHMMIERKKAILDRALTPPLIAPVKNAKAS